jgi:hypothetical protein
MVMVTEQLIANTQTLRIRIIAKVEGLYCQLRLMLDHLPGTGFYLIISVLPCHQYTIVAVQWFQGTRLPSTPSIIRKATMWCLLLTPT